MNSGASGDAATVCDLITRGAARQLPPSVSFQTLASPCLAQLFLADRIKLQDMDMLIPGTHAVNRPY